MIRVSTIFIAICMVLIAASVGMGLYGLLGLSGSESAIVALTALTVLILYHAVATRLRDRTDVGGQIADLSRGTADLARQVAEFGRRLVAVEQKLAKDSSAQSQSNVKPLMSEINELGSLVRQLAITVSTHDQQFAGLSNETKAAAPQRRIAAAVEAPALPAEALAETEPSTAEQMLDEPRADPAPRETVPAAAIPDIPVARPGLEKIIREAVEANRIDLYLQPMVTLPQRKVRYYEAVARLRQEDDKNGDNVLSASEFIGAAEAAGLLARIDHLVLFRCVQVLRRLIVRSKDIGIFCNIGVSTLGDPAIFPQCFEFLDANRALAPSFILEFTQSAFRKLGPVEIEHLAALSKCGFKFSIDNVTDLKIEPRELADRGVRFIKVPAPLLLEKSQNASPDIHPADLSDLLGRYGIDLIAERIEGERAVVDLLDYDVRYGQGFLFSPPRPMRPDSSPAVKAKVSAAAPTEETVRPAAPAKPDPSLTRTGGIAALARRVSSPN